MIDPLDALPVVFDMSEIPTDGIKLVVDGWADSEDPDEDNSVLEGVDFDALPVERHLESLATPRLAQVKVVGPLRRELRYKKAMIRGKDVRAVNRALSRAGVIRWKTGGLFPLVAGMGFRRAVTTFQRRHGLAADGVYGNATHRALGRFFDAYAIRLYQDAKIGLTGNELKRQQFRSHALYLYHMRHRVHYTMGGSRMTIVRRWLLPGRVFDRGDIYEDCSSIGKGICHLVGIPDPNGFGYGTQQHPNVWGFTGTMAAHGTFVPARLSSLKIGDAILTGNSPYTHVWYYIGGGLAMSHGKEADPRIVPWDYRPVAAIRRYIT